MRIGLLLQTFPEKGVSKVQMGNTLGRHAVILRAYGHGIEIKWHAKTLDDLPQSLQLNISQGDMCVG